MGNCQAAEAATVVIQHPGGRVESVYWSLTAGDVMASNPGHYVAVIITSSTPNSRAAAPVKHLKLLRPDDTLHIGHVYRLVTFEEVLREFGSKKRVRLSRLLANHQKDDISRERRRERRAGGGGGGRGRRDSDQVNTTTMEVEQQQQEEEVVGIGSTAGPGGRRSGAGMLKQCQWRPTLQSIQEAGG